jgi:hypothetical protein
VAHRARLRLLGDGWTSYGRTTIPDDKVVEVSEEEAATYLRYRGRARSVEFVEWVEDPADAEEQPQT